MSAAIASAQAATARSAGGSARRQPRSPRALTGGESLTPVEGEKGAIVDWLSFTFLHELLKNDGVAAIRNELEAATGCKFFIEETNGKHGFTNGYRFYAVRFVGASPQCVPFCEYAYGGESQQGRAYLSISGTGCALVSDWYVLHRFMHLLQARITRVDLAVDFMDGEFNLEHARAAYTEGLFQNGGNRPGAQLIDDFDSGAGKTLNVGKRVNGKMARVYEKGRQIGNRESPWTRFEIELHNRDRVIPLDVVIRPSDYWVGQYRVTQNLIDAAAEKIKTLRAEQEISLDRMMRYLRLAYGRLIHVQRLIDGEQFDPTEFVKEIELQGIPRRLEKTALHFLNGPPASPSLGESHAS